MCREDKQFDPFAETPVDGVIAAQVNQSHSVFIEGFIFCRLFVSFPFSFPWVFLSALGFVRFSVSFPFVAGFDDLQHTLIHSKHAGGGDLDLHFFRSLHPLKGTVE
jgi:hypothetical protein